jgi:hypothetical protein
MTEIHQYAKFLPMMSTVQFEALVEDIRQNGLLHPISLLNGEIIDGRNRYLACLQAGVEPVYEDLPLSSDPMRIVISGECRRQITSDQKALIAAHVWRDVFAPLAKERMGGANVGTPGTAARQAARMFQVDEDKVRHADKVLRDSATLANYNEEAGSVWMQVRDGHLSLKEAETALTAWAEAYEIDTEFTKAGERAIERKRKAAEQQRAIQLARQQEEARLIEEAGRRQAEALLRAEREAQAAQDRAARAALAAANASELARIEEEAREAETAAKLTLAKEQFRIDAEQRKAREEMLLRQKAEDNAKRQEVEEKRLRTANFNKTQFHLHTAGVNLFQALTLMETTVYTLEQMEAFGVKYRAIEEAFNKMLNWVVTNET